MGWEERQIWRGESGEKQANVNGLLATQVQEDARAWAMTKGPVLI